MSFHEDLYLAITEIHEGNPIFQVFYYVEALGGQRCYERWPPIQPLVMLDSDQSTI